MDRSSYVMVISIIFLLILLFVIYNSKNFIKLITENFENRIENIEN